MRTWRIRVVIASLFFFLGLMGLAKPLYATGFMISPGRQFIFGERQQPLKVTYHLENESDAPTKCKLFLHDVKKVNSLGVAEFETENAVVQEWLQSVTLEVKGEKTEIIDPQQILTGGVVLKPHQSAEVTLEFLLPAQIERKAEYLGVFFHFQPIENISLPPNVGVQYRIGSLLGIVIKDLETLTKLRVKVGKWHVVDNQLKATVMIKNDGNVHLQPVGTAWMTSLRGKWKSEVVKINSDGHWVLPANTLEAEIPLGQLRKWPIQFFVLHTESHIEQQQVTEKVLAVFVQPYVWVMVQGAGIGTVVGVAIMLSRYHRRLRSERR